MNYTLIVHKSSGSTSCRGCIMDQWDSDFDIQYFKEDETEELIKQAAYYKLINLKDEELGNYEITILYDGIERYAHEEYDSLPDLSDEVYKLAKQQVDDYNTKKEQKRLADEQTKQDRKKQHDLELLAKLKQQYGE